jgi:diguanylate cyclase (GGDEF)-like protein
LTRVVIPVAVAVGALLLHSAGWGIALIPCLALTATLSVSQHRAKRELRFQAFHDSLTGLANRALFGDRLEQALVRRQRAGGRVGLMLIDLDDFKTVNDSRGHGVGDEVLEVVSRRLVGCTRSTDTVARLGGDEFAVLVESWQKPDELERMARRVLTVFDVAVPLAEGQADITVSIGLAQAEREICDPAELLRHADDALYAAKAGGKARAVFSDGSLARVTFDR